jgi:uncharacterized Zn finger protein
LRYDDYYGGFGFRPYVPVAERQRRAAREMEKRRKQGHAVLPVVIEGRAIAKTFWGKAWCENLERYSDYANRLPRGRTYVRNGSVVHLEIAPGAVSAFVCGSALYKIEVKIAPLEKARWKAICKDCAGGIDSLVELLQGKLSQGVMERICRQGQGLFPSPKEISLKCSCPDWASMCKHVAAVLYGIGARLDHEPELLFRLREVDEQELIARAGSAISLGRRGPAADRILEAEDLAGVFGLDMAAQAAPKPKRAKGPAEAVKPKPLKALVSKKAAPPVNRKRKSAKTAARKTGRKRT